MPRLKVEHFLVVRASLGAVVKGLGVEIGQVKMGGHLVGFDREQALQLVGGVHRVVGSFERQREVVSCARTEWPDGEGLLTGP